MDRWAPKLGPNVTRVKIEGGMHDLALSAPPVRAHMYQELFRWAGAYLPQPDMVPAAR